MNGDRAVVACSNGTAARVGAAVLREGGNAVDAAVAVSLALGVVEPFHSGTGGGCFMLRYDGSSGEIGCLDARGVAPAAATPDMFLKDGEVDVEATMIGHRSVVVPGLLAGLGVALERWGSRPFSALAEPAARLARHGFPITPIMAALCANPITERALAAHPEGSRLYLRGGAPLRVGDHFENPDLAATLRRLGRQGVRDFYEGELARAFAAEMARGGGLITLDDLARYRPRDLEPLRTGYHGFEVVGMPPPSSGGLLVAQALNILEDFELQAMGRFSTGTLHVLSETMKLCFTDRNRFVGDPAFVDVPIAGLLSKEYARVRAAEIHIDRAGSYRYGQPGGLLGSHTTHFCVADRWGTIVSQTQTIGMNLASGVVIPSTGVILNHTMSDFSPGQGKPTGFGWGAYTSAANSIEPGKTPASSQAPTIVLRDGRPCLAAGAAGGSRIPTTVLQVILNALNFGMEPQAAVDAPRIHDQGEGLELEEPLFRRQRSALTGLGHRVTRSQGYHERMLSWCQALTVREDGSYAGGADPRGDGAVAG